MRFALTVMLASVVAPAVQAASVLLVADEWPAMEILEEHLAANGFTVEKCEQEEMPEDLSGYHAILNYVHGRFHDEPAQAMIDYANDGGRLILLHHGINSGQVRTKGWLDFVGFVLDKKRTGYLCFTGDTHKDVNWTARITDRSGDLPGRRNEPHQARRPYGCKDRRVGITSFDLQDRRRVRKQASGKRKIWFGSSYGVATDEAGSRNSVRDRKHRIGKHAHGDQHGGRQGAQSSGPTSFQITFAHRPANGHLQPFPMTGKKMA